MKALFIAATSFASLFADPSQAASEKMRTVIRDDFKTLAELKAASSPVAGDEQPTPAVEVSSIAAPAPAETKLIVGDGTSSLTHDRAIDLAQRLAAFIPGAAVADLSGDYAGRYSPAVPTNAVFVVEPVVYANSKPFDLVVFKDPSGALRCRQLLAKNGDTALVGFGFLEQSSQAQIDGKVIVGRVVATIRFDPSSK